MQLLKIENLSAHISTKGEQSLTLFKGVNLQMNTGETTALLQLSGMTGCVLLKAMAGLYPHSNGKIIFKGQDMETVPVSDIGFTSPALFHPETLNDSVAHYLLPSEKRKFNFFTSQAKNSESQIRQYLKGINSELADCLEKNINELPPLQTAFLSLLPALLKQPELLLLDTLTTLLPEEMTGQLLQYLLSRPTSAGKALLFTTRSPQLAFRLAKRIYILDDQTVIREVINDHQSPEILEQLFRATEFSDYSSAESPGISGMVSEQYV